MFCLFIVFSLFFFFFFFNDTATTEIYTLSLHDALPISHGERRAAAVLRLRRARRAHRAGRRHAGALGGGDLAPLRARDRDRKSTRLNSSHVRISYAVFCLKKKKKQNKHQVSMSQIKIHT